MKGSLGTTKGGAVIFPMGPIGGKKLEGRGSGKEPVSRTIAINKRSRQRNVERSLHEGGDSKGDKGASLKENRAGK